MHQMQIPPAIAEGIERMIRENGNQDEGPVNELAIQVDDSPNTLRERILEGLTIASAFADRLEDLDYAQAVRDKLTRSNVRGSRIEGIKNINDVQRMLESVTDWNVIDSNLKDKNIECIEGTLPPEYANRSYAAYASIREISSKFGQSGLSTIQAKAGNQKDDEFYLCTVLRIPTNTITVQLKQEINGAGYEYLHQWFAGPELTSLLRLDDGDTMVRCGVVIPLINSPKHHASQNKSHNRPAAH